jgi:ribosomal protein S8E
MVANETVFIANKIQNPQNPMYTQLGVLTKGTIIEVNGMSFQAVFIFKP